MMGICGSFSFDVTTRQSESNARLFQVMVLLQKAPEDMLRKSFYLGLGSFLAIRGCCHGQTPMVLNDTMT